MKQVKKLAVLATIALGAMSCSNNEVIESLNEQNEIRFSGIQMGNSIITKANQILTGSETFGVYAYQTSPSATPWFADQKLAKTGTAWGLPTKFYYPTGNFSMTFWAYGTDFAKNKPTSVSSTGLVYTNYSINQTNAADHEAFVISKNASTVTQDNKASGVALNFWHALSKIQFKAAKSDEPELTNVDVEISSISINTNQTGSLTYTGDASTWTQTGNNQDVAIYVTGGALTTESASVTNEFYVIPLAGKAINTITVVASFYHKGTNVKIANDATGTIEATADLFKINNKVTYNMTLAKNNLSGHTEITFAEPTIEDWKPVTGGNVFPTQP